MEDDDFLDGCDLDFTDPEKITTDEDIDALVLFADVDFLDPISVLIREQELFELFGDK